MAEQLKVDPGEFAAYPWSGRSAKYHREQIRAVYGFREFSVGDEDKLTGWPAAEMCPVELRDEQLREALLVRCRVERIEPTTPGRIDRLIGSARASFEKQFCERTVSRLSQLSIDRLNNLVAVGAAPLASGRNLLAELKSDPGKVSLETLLREVDKLAAVRALELPADLFADASEKLVDAWRARAARAFPSDLRDMPDPIMLTLLAVLCWVRSAEITDALVDLLIELVHKIGARADRRVEKELTEDLKRVRGKEGILFRLAEAAVEHPDDIVRDYAAIRQPLDPTEFITGLQQRMSKALAGLDQGLAEETTGGVRLTRRRGEQWISVPKLDKQTDPENLEKIKAEVARRWGTLDLLDVLKDADFLTDFTSVASREVIDRDTLRKRLLLDLFALGTNMGICASTPS
jgi:hypothetical protein